MQYTSSHSETVAGLTDHQSRSEADRRRYRALDILRNNLLSVRERNTGVRASVFCNDLKVLKHAMSIHAILPETDPSSRDCQLVLLKHLLTGACVNCYSHSNGQAQDYTACHCIADGFLSAEDQAAAAMDIVLNADSDSIPTRHLMLIADALKVSFDAKSKSPRRSICVALKRYVNVSVARTSHCASADLELKDIEILSRPSLFALASRHQIPISRESRTDNVRSLIMKHITKGRCLQKPSLTIPEGCSNVADNIKLYDDSDIPLSDMSSIDRQIAVLSSLVKSLSLRPLRRLLQMHDVPYAQDAGRAKLRRELKKFITRLRKGKRSEIRRNQDATQYTELLNKKKTVCDEWPRLVPKNLKDKIIRLFNEQTSKKVLSSFTCASCAENCVNKDKCEVPSDQIDLNLLSRPDRRLLEGHVVDDNWLDSECQSPPVPYTEGPLKDCLIDPAGVMADATGKYKLMLCRTCASALRKHKVPPLSLANHTFLGHVPNELKDLTVVEESMIARCRSKCWVVHMKEQDQDLALPHDQRGFRGHVIIYPQRPSDVASTLPPPMDEITTPVCVIFVGSKPPTTEWLQKKAKPLVIRREKVRAALIWLKDHNPYYKDITINHSMLDGLAARQILPVHVEHILPSHAEDVLTSRYDPSIPLETNTPAAHEPVPFQNVVITDVDGNAPANELRAAAVRHIKKKGGGYIEISHDPEPVNEFCNPSLFPMIYPCLFPYGIGGFEDSKRSSKLSLKRHVKHLFSLADRRFQEHYSFLFTSFNILQRRAVLIHSSLKVRKANFKSIAGDFASVSPNAVHIVSERISRGDFATANNDEERKVLNLMKQVKLVTSHVPGSSASRVTMRNEIRGLMMDRGLPSFYITINPADVFNPLVKFLAGSEIDIDCLMPDDVPNSREQSLLIARNPAVAARFFNIYMKAFISAILGYDPKQENLEGGILGITKAYYGCVEHQGRGSLHCHMMIWVEGGLNPNEIKQRVLQEGDTNFRDRLIAFLDDTISNCIPDDPDPNLVVPSSEHHPCSVRSVDLNRIRTNSEMARQKDMHNLVKACQSHTHSGACYKYWKGPPDPKECRFDLHENNFCPESAFDYATGDICLRCLDGMVNNFNDTILEAVRCNMDIKFIGSGASAKAILYYITDYITKSQLKTHVAFAALELAVKKLGEYDPEADEFMTRSKRLLQKCAYAMISHQELSAQLVCSYLMDFGDHFTSHEYKNIYWTSFEKFINDEDPSPECYLSDQSINDNPPQEHEQNLSVDQFDHLSDTFDEVVDPTLSDIAGETDHSIRVHDQTDQTDDEIVVSIDQFGQMVAKANQVADYQLRDDCLKDICVWDFVAQVEKVKRGTERKSVPKDDDDLDYRVDDDEEDSDEDSEENSPSFNAAQSTKLLTVRTRTRPRVHLRPEHMEAASHLLRIRAPNKRFVPVPIGPSIPRRDRLPVRERYCRLMLILFKPWKHACDLRSPGQSWSDAFEHFLRLCPTDKKAVMDNMQILHECRDSRDDHFAERRNSGRNRSNRVSVDLLGENTADDEFDGLDHNALILNHFEAIDNAHSQRMSNSKDAVRQCLHSADKTGLHQTARQQNPSTGLNNTLFELGPDTKATSLEETWRKAYDDRRDRWKRSFSRGQEPTENSECHPYNQPSSYLLRDGSAFRKAEPEERNIHLPAIRQEIIASDADQIVDISAIIKEYNLNAEQARAFQIVSGHSLKTRPDPLRMYLGGPGGTGKSRVINALKDFFERRNQGRRFRLASYTGVAAKNISGMTLHTALSLNQRSKGTRGKTHHDLVAMWEGVDYLFIDEVSMIGCNLMLQISEALTEAKGNTSAFGGISIIFAGDFAQLPPVGQNRLFGHVNTAEAGTKKGQSTIFGKLLWLSVKTVVILTEIKRQAGAGNERFVSLLSRLREGKCTNEDYELLTSRVLGNVTPDWSDPAWAGVPVIVSDNEVKDALNAQGAIRFAQQSGQELHWYFATDRQGKNLLSDNALRSRLETLHSGLTNQRLGKVPLVLGMPVMISQNFDVDAGIVNGCTGILKQIRYRTDNEGRRHAISCVVHTPNTSGENMPHLPEHHVVALEDCVDMIFIHPHSKRKCKIKRTQIPILPAFAMTAHKAQGQTMTNVVVDLESCKGTEAPYVMISRVKSLDGLLILRPFKRQKIQCRQSEDVRREMRRLEFLRLHTITEFGTAEESAGAQNVLAKTRFQKFIGNDNDEDNAERAVNSGDAARRLRHLQNEFRLLTDIEKPSGSSKKVSTNLIPASIGDKRQAPGEHSDVATIHKRRRL